MTPNNQPTPQAETLRLLAAIDASNVLIAEGITALREEIHYLASIMEPTAETSARIHETLDKLGGALTQKPGPLAPSAAIQQPAGPFRDFHAETVLLSYDDSGAPTYRVKGAPFSKFGVRLWPETLPALGIDPAALKPGPNPVNLMVRAALNPETNQPRKIIGLATPLAPATPANEEEIPF